jgi:competence protein ComEC
MWVRLALAYAAALLGPPAAALLVGVAACVRRRRFDTGHVPAIALAMALGRLDVAPPAPPLAAARAASAVGWIASAPERDGRGGVWCWFAVDAFAGPESAAWRRRRLRLHAATPLSAYGTRIAVAGRIRPAAGPRNFGAADARAWLHAAGASAEFDAAAWRRIPGRAGPAWRRELLEPARARLQAAIESVLAPAAAGLLSALVLGRRDGIDPALAAAWSALGLTHVLSISGMHVALVAAALVAIAGAPCRGRGLVAFVSGLWAYAALGGLGPTVLRAALMATWAACALYAGRARTPLVALAVASMILVLDAPERRQDLGLQLSCLSTAGLLCWAPVLARLAARGAARGGVVRWAAAAGAAAGIGLAAQAATLPLVVWRFGVVPWIAPIANLVAVPASDVALVLALVGAPVSLVCESLGRPLLVAAGALVHGLTWASVAAVTRGETRWFVPADVTTVAGAAVFAATACACGLAASAGRVRCARVLAALGGVALALFVVACLWPRAPAWQVEALDVGQGDALLVRVGRSAWLVDTGDARPVDRGARVVLPHLRRSGVRRLRGLVLTHPHRDHCGGAAAVLAGIAVDTVYVARASWEDSLYAGLRRIQPQVAWRALARGDTLSLAPGYRAAVLWPWPRDTIESGANDCSLVLWARGTPYPDLWLMGDLETAGEVQLVAADASVASGAPHFALLKAGHHGSDTSSTPAFVDALRPEVALISVGAGNRYRHPGRRALATLAARGCTVVRTDQGGAVRIVQRGATLWLERPASRRLALAAPG